MLRPGVLDEAFWGFDGRQSTAAGNDEVFELFQEVAGPSVLAVSWCVYFDAREALVAYRSVYNSFCSHNAPLSVHRNEAVRIPVRDGSHGRVGLQIEFARFEYYPKEGVDKFVWPPAHQPLSNDPETTRQLTLVRRDEPPRPHTPSSG